MGCWLDLFLRGGGFDRVEGVGESCFIDAVGSAFEFVEERLAVLGVLLLHQYNYWR